MRLLVCGDRRWTDRAAIRRELEALRPALVIHGAQGRRDRQGRLVAGADMMADEEARALGIPTDPHPYIGRLGRAGGPVRNQQMLEEGRPDEWRAFHPDLAASRGTKDMVRRLRKAGVPGRVVGDPAEEGA